MKHHITKTNEEVWIEFPDHGILISVYPWDEKTTDSGLKVYPFVAWRKVEGDEPQLIHSDEVLREDWDANGVLSITHIVQACVAILAMTAAEQIK